MKFSFYRGAQIEAYKQNGVVYARMLFRNKAFDFQGFKTENLLIERAKRFVDETRGLAK